MLTLTRVDLGAVGIKPGDVRMVTTDATETVAAAGYLSNSATSAAKAVGLSPSDLITALTSYDPVAGTGVMKQYTVAISNGVIDLAVYP